MNNNNNNVLSIQLWLLMGLGMSTTKQQGWKKFTKQHRQNFETEKLAHKICAKKEQRCAQKQAKMPKIAPKKTF